MSKSAVTNLDITIFDVAREAGVSYATVSRVINNKQDVKPQTREHVLRTMARLGYVANQQARRLAGGQSRIIGLLIQGMGSSYIGEIVRGIDEELDKADYDLMLYTTHRRKTREASYAASIARGLADGLILVVPRNPEAYLATLRTRRFPYVLIDHQGNGQDEPSVGATNRQGAYDATRYLIELGHRRIGFVTGAMELLCAMERLEGFRAALSDYGLPFDPALLREGDFLSARAAICAQELLSLSDRPTAIFASNDDSALSILEVARERGLHVPQDLSLVGFDDIPLAAHVYPPLTTVRQPMEHMGREATRMLIQAIQQPSKPIRRVEVPTEFIIRKSCQAPSLLQSIS